MEYNIRKMTREDANAVAHVITTAWNETYKGIVSDQELAGMYLDIDKRTQKYYNKFNDSNNHQFVLEVDNKVVGYMNVGQAKELGFNGWGQIYALYIIGGYKGKGYGRKLVDVGIKELKRLGYDKMIIGCLVGNPANEFYKHMGGKIVKEVIFERLQLPENIYCFERI